MDNKLVEYLQRQHIDKLTAMVLLNNPPMTCIIDGISEVKMMEDKEEEIITEDDVEVDENDVDLDGDWNDKDEDDIEDDEKDEKEEPAF